MNTPTSGEFEARVKQEAVKLGYWTLAWVLSTALVAFGPMFMWDARGLTVAAIALNVLLGAGMIRANKHHLESLDELQQKIQLQAMGLTLGVTLVAGLAYSMLDTTNLIASDAEISFLIILMGLTYMTTLLFLNRKYR